jgi:hypothetical protein
MKATSHKKNHSSVDGLDLCRKHFGKFNEEIDSGKRLSLFNSEAIRHECIRAFSKLRLLRDKPKNKVGLKRAQERRRAAKNLLK